MLHILTLIKVILKSVLRPIVSGFRSGSQQTDAFWINIWRRGTRRGKWGEKDRENRRIENRQTETKQAWTGDGQWEERSVNPVSVNPIRLGWGAVFRKKAQSVALPDQRKQAERNMSVSVLASWLCGSIARMFLKLCDSEKLKTVERCDES